MRPLLILILLLVAPALAMAQGPSAPILRMKLDKQTAIPGQPIILTLTLLVPTWMPRPPRFPSFEAPNVMVRLPRGASGPTSARIGATTWSGITRAYRIYPMTAGHFRIPPQTVAVTFADPETRKPVSMELRTDEVIFQGKLPAGGESLDPFIAAEALTLDQTLEGTPGKLERGGAFTRTLTATIRGTSPIFLPPLIPPLKGRGLAVYPKQPLVTESMKRGLITGRRLESITYLAETGGRHAAPPVKLRWYNLRTKRVATTEVSGFDVVARGPAATLGRSLDWRGAASWAITIVPAIILAVLLSLWFRPRIRVWNRRRREVYLASEACAFANAEASLRAREFGSALRAIEIWSPRLPAAPGAETDRLFHALGRLGAAFYGRSKNLPSGSAWSEALAALRAVRKRRLAVAAHAGETLAPLNPRMV